MKKTTLTLLAALALGSALADDNHGKIQAGPNGGRVIDSVEPHAEVFVTPDRKIQITFLDEKLRPIPPAGQSVTVICGDRSSPTRLTFTASGNALVSNATLPDGDNIPAVVRIQPSATDPVVTEKFHINLAKCPTCAHQEYACVCDH